MIEPHVVREFALYGRAATAAYNGRDADILDELRLGGGGTDGPAQESGDPHGHIHNGAFGRTDGEAAGATVWTATDVAVAPWVVRG